MRTQVANGARLKISCLVLHRFESCRMHSLQWDGVLVRFGEIGIKSPPVRRQMAARLRQNLLDGLLRESVEGDVQLINARLWMVGPDADALLRVATHTFGVVSASPCITRETTLDAMGEGAAALAMQHDWNSFAIRARRDGDHTFTSQDMGIEIGKAVWHAAEGAGRTPSVDLSNPDLEVHVDARRHVAYIHTDTVPGPGGLPVGTQGRVAALLSDPASFVAAWLMMRRGCHVNPIHAGTTGSLPIDNMDAMHAWGMKQTVDLLPICTGFVGKATLLGAADAIARKGKCDAIITGDTIDSDLVMHDGLPLLRPVCGLLPSEVEALQNRIGLVDDEPEHIFDPDSHETVETALSMHNVVTL